jgi:predicted secreted protein
MDGEKVIADHTEEHLQIGVGETVSITLPSLPGAGAIWSVGEKPEGVLIDRKEVQESTNGVGGIVPVKFELIAKSSGMHVVEFVFKRPWEENVRKVYQVVLTVTDSKSTPS